MNLLELRNQHEYDRHVSGFASIVVIVEQRSTNHCLLIFGLGVGGLVDRDVAPGPTKDVDPGSCPVSECHVVHVTEIKVEMHFGCCLPQLQKGAFTYNKIQQRCCFVIKNLLYNLINSD